MQCCFFGDKVSEYRNFLKVGAWYRFEDPFLQMNNRLNILQLKITAISKITKEDTEQPPNPGNVNSDKPSSSTKPQRQIEAFDFSTALKLGFDATKNYFVIGRVIKNNVIKSDSGRSFECVDEGGNSFQVMLWNDCQEEVTVGQTYKFSDLKAKTYKDKITLQSQWKYTKVTPQITKLQPKN